MGDVLEQYGFQTSKNGRIPCPLHNGHDRNFAYSTNHFKCFVCNRSGDVISFVMELYGIDFGQAVIRINDDFGMGLTASTGRTDALRKRREIAAEKLRKEREKAAVLAEMNELSVIRRRLWMARINEAPATPDEPLTPMFVLPLQEIDWLDWQIWQLYDKWKEMG